MTHLEYLLEQGDISDQFLTFVNSRLQTYQIFRNNDQMLIVYLNYFITTVMMQKYL